ncbi:hypothetical protein JOQ06_012838 [Pogonophryne albipinna]|uniref:DUF4371 domain-containing protein n=1 Tax=Pogonophryne albipinna TaxID=1090488 RepID=A0AAD6BIG5_9TELE|nr:hypothetical protein JOQ06_012838 [Pogonophryne albipinna]
MDIRKWLQGAAATRPPPTPPPTENEGNEPSSSIAGTTSEELEPCSSTSQYTPASQAHPPAAANSDLREKLGLLNGKIEKTETLMFQMNNTQSKLKDAATKRKTALAAVYQQIRDMLVQEEQNAQHEVDSELEIGQTKLQDHMKRLTVNTEKMTKARESINNLLSQSQTMAFLQKLNGLNVGRVLHSNKTCGEIIDHIAHELKKKMAKDITENQRKLCVLVDESTTISGKTVLVVCLRSALADAEPETFFWELIELDGTTADDITKALMECLGRDFNEDFLGQCFVSFACDGASVMLGKRTGVATQLCSKFPSLFVWHCSNHRLELAVGDVVKEVSGLNHFQIFFDKLYSLFHASPKNQRQLAQCAQAVGQRLLVIGRVLSIRWVASSERSVRAVWENYRVLHDHFTNAANDTSRDSRDRAKYKGLDDVLTSATFVSNLGLMYDALTELSDLSRQLQKREMTLPTADRLLTREIRVFESMVTMPGPHMTTVHTALAEKSFKGVALRENGRLVQIHAGQFFRSMVENLRHRMTSTTSSHVSTREIPLHGREARDNQLIQDMKVIHPGSWPEEELDVQYGDVEASFNLPKAVKFDPHMPQVNLDSKKVTASQACSAALKQHLAEILKQPVEARLLTLKPEQDRRPPHNAPGGYKPNMKGNQ